MTALKRVVMLKQHLSDAVTNMTIVFITVYWVALNCTGVSVSVPFSYLSIFILYLSDQWSFYCISISLSTSLTLSMLLSFSLCLSVCSHLMSPSDQLLSELIKHTFLLYQKNKLKRIMTGRPNEREERG